MHIHKNNIVIPPRLLCVFWWYALYVRFSGIMGERQWNSALVFSNMTAFGALSKEKTSELL